MHAVLENEQEFIDVSLILNIIVSSAEYLQFSNF